MRKTILFLGFAVLTSGSTVFAAENTAMSGSFAPQSCGISDNRLCDALTNTLMKEVLKQAVYTVGTQVLNKYMNSNSAIPASIPPSTVINYAPVATPAPAVYVPAVTPAPVNTATTVNTAAPAVNNTPEEQMIIVN